MRDVAIVATAQSHNVRKQRELNEVEMIMPVIAEVSAKSGIDRKAIGFTCSGSCDYLIGAPFSFVSGLDAVGAWPPIRESHVEMDGAWALYEAWVKIQTGEVDSALIYCFGKSSLGPLADILALQLDPYTVAPLWPDSISLAALQARAWLDEGGTEEEMAEVASRSRRSALDNEHAQVKGDWSVEELLKEPYLTTPLRKHDCPPLSDAAAAVVLAADDLARDVCDSPAWITGIDHRIDVASLGARDLASSSSAAKAAEVAGVGRGPVDVAELHACFTHQEPILKAAMGLNGTTDVNPSGGPLAANALMVAGLVRIIEAADRVSAGTAGRAVAHATSGPCLQQNLVCVLEGGKG